MNDNFELPDYLYKYRTFSPRALDGLREKAVWFSTADALNDPFDSNCRIDTRVPLEHQQEIKSQMFLFCVQMNELNGGTEIVNLSNNPQLPEDSKFSWSCKEFARFAFLCSIYSLSDNPLHPLMWAHYCNSYNGFVIGFDTQQKNPKNWLEPRPVEYLPEPISVDISNLVGLDGVNYEVLEEFETAIGYTKSFMWEYESEWRFVANRHPSGLQPQPYEIGKVMFGYRLPKEHREEILNAIGRNVPFQVVVPDLKNYSLRLIDPESEDHYMRDFDRSLRTITNRTDFVGTADFRQHQ